MLTTDLCSKLTVDIWPMLRTDLFQQLTYIDDWVLKSVQCKKLNYINNQPLFTTNCQHRAYINKWNMFITDWINNRSRLTFWSNNLKQFSVLYFNFYKHHRQNPQLDASQIFIILKMCFISYFKIGNFRAKRPQTGATLTRRVLSLMISTILSQIWDSEIQESCSHQTLYSLLTSSNKIKVK